MEARRACAMRSVEGYLSSKCSTQPAAMSSASVASSGKTRGGRLLDNGEACHGLAFGIVAGAFGEVRLLIVLVAFGLADGQGDGQAEAAQELFEIGGVLGGRGDAGA